MRQINILVEELKKRLDAGENIHLVDVREAYEHKDFNIGGILIPLAEIMSSLDKLPKNKDEELVIYCRSGNRSLMAQELLIEGGGYTNVKNLKGGLLAWSEMSD